MFYKNIVGVIGSGKMGADIFNYLSDFDIKLIWVCSKNADIEKIKTRFTKRQERALNNSLISSEEYYKKIESIVITTEYQDLKDCTLIIESITENEKLKADLFKTLDKIINKDCIFTSNSSSISPEILSESVGRKEKFLNLHFFYPVKLKNISEIISSGTTSDKSIDYVKGFMAYINKFYLLQDNKSAFILNRLFLELQAEAYNIFINSDKTIEEIDIITKNKLFPIGIFEMMDHVGLDTMCSSVKKYINYSEDKNKYFPIIEGLEKLVKLDRLGLKNKKGFYSYPKDDDFDINNFKENPQTINTEDIENQLVEVYKKSARNIVDQGLCSKNDLEYSISQYMDTDISPFDL